MKTLQKLRIALVHGGTSSESRISTKNAHAIQQALLALGHDVRPIEYDRTICTQLVRFAPDLVFISVQGKGHGDGTIQAICDHLGLPYTGSKTTAAAIINHKAHCKKIARYHGIRTPDFLCFGKNRFFASPPDAVFDQIENNLAYPVVAKGTTQGGSFGVTLIRSRQDYDRFVCAFEWDDEIIIERYLAGPFVTGSVLEEDKKLTTLTPLIGENTSPPLEGLTLFNRDFRAYKADLPRVLLDEIETMALNIAEALQARNYCRVDFMIDALTGLPHFLEINAVPGLKPESFFPQAAALSGMSLTELIGRIVENEIANF